MAGRGLNPIDGDNSTQTKPTFPTNADTLRKWFRDCTSPAAEDGTEMFAGDANLLLHLMRHALDAYSVSDDPPRESLLTELLQAVETSAVAPIFPHVEATDGLLHVTAGSGSVTVDTGGEFVWRGYQRIETTDFDLADRQFPTTGGATYHVRWHAPGTGDATPAATYPNGRFRLENLADSGYNPTAAAETAEKFDTTYDSMLIARVVTDGSNVATVTELSNRQILRAVAAFSDTPDTNPGDNSSSITFTMNLNWSRSPLTAAIPRTWSFVDNSSDTDMSTSTSAVTRYAFDAFIRYDFSTQLAVTVTADA